jgi:hypothetical protein
MVQGRVARRSSKLNVPMQKSAQESHNQDETHVRVDVTPCKGQYMVGGTLQLEGDPGERPWHPGATFRLNRPSSMRPKHGELARHDPCRLKPPGFGRLRGSLHARSAGRHSRALVIRLSTRCTPLPPHLFERASCSCIAFGEPYRPASLRIRARPATFSPPFSRSGHPSRTPCLHLLCTTFLRRFQRGFGSSIAPPAAKAAAPILSPAVYVEPVAADLPRNLVSTAAAYQDAEHRRG